MIAVDCLLILSLITSSSRLGVSVTSLIGSDSSIFSSDDKTWFLLAGGVLNILNTGLSNYVKSYKYDIKIHTVNITTSLLNILKNKIMSTLIQKTQNRENANLVIERFTNDYNIINDMINTALN